MVLIFDLDDTLYEELSYVRIGYKAVADYIYKYYGINSDELYNKLYKQVLITRNNVFDIVFDEYNIKNKTIIKKSLMIYRKHKPVISLYPDAISCLERYKNTDKFIVTDGNKVVQNNKCQALKLNDFVNKCIITHRYGVKNAKPSPYVFNLLAQIMGVASSQIIYIADNPIKDFIGIKPLGFKTIRIKRGMFASLNMDKEHEADLTINSLDEINDDLLKILV